MLCAALSHQLRHCTLARPLISLTNYQTAKIPQTSYHQFISLPSIPCGSRPHDIVNKNIINSKSHHNRFHSGSSLSTPQKSQTSSHYYSSHYHSNTILTTSSNHYHNHKTTDLLSISTQSHVLSGHQINFQDSFHPIHLNIPSNVLHTKPPGSTEYTKGAINIPRLILDASPTSAQPYLQMIRFDRPIGTWLLYWPCTWSIALAAQPGCLPDFYMLALFGAGAFFMRGSGCIINDMWDKDFDNKVERTRDRPLASGKITYTQAMVFLASQLSISLAILLQLNWYSIFLGAASLGIVITYPAFKRFTYWPQIVLGFAFNYGALLGWSAVQGSCDWSVCIPLYFLCHMWTMIYDTVYAHQDKSDDLLIGVKSTALKFGDQTKPWLAGFTACMAGGLLCTGHLMDMTWPYYTGASIAIASIVRQLYRLDIDNPQACGDAFRFHFYIGLLMFVSIMCGNLAKPKIDKEKEDEPESKALTALA